MKCAGKLLFGLLTAISIFLSGATRAGELPEGWSRLKIRLPGVKAEPEVVGMGHSYVGRRLDGFWHELVLPRVAWIRIGVPTKRGNLETLIPYRGAGEWVVTINDLVVSVSRDGAPPEVVGVSLPVDGAEDFLATFDASSITQPVSLELRNAGHPPLIPKVPFPFHAIVADDIKFDGVSSLWIMSRKPKALSLDLEYSDLSFVGLSKGIEALHVEVRNVPTRKEGAKKRQVAVDELFLPDMPNLKDLSISAPAATDDFVDTMLRSTPGIRMVFFNCSSYYTFPVKWKNIDQLFNLESLHIKKGVRISAVELSRLEKLRSITFGDHAFDANDPGLPGWLNKPQMLAIHSSHHCLSDALWDRWAKAGGLASVIRLETFNNLDLPKLESVEFLLMRRKKVALELFSDAYISQLGELENLAYLSIEFPNQEALESLSRLSGRDHIETVKIVNGTWTDPAPLASLSQLKRIIVMNSKEVEKVDLSIFPKLKTFAAFNMSELREVQGIASHPELESVAFQSCKSLVDLGEAAPNQTLRSFAIHRCAKVEHLEVLSETSGLQQLILDGCPQLKGPREILDNNPVGYSYIKSAGVFEDRNVHEP